jgi:hypothetical protein
MAQAPANHPTETGIPLPPASGQVTASPSGPTLLPIKYGTPAVPSTVPDWHLRKLPRKKRALLIPHVLEDGTAEEYYPGDVVPTLLIDPKTGRQVVNDLKRFIKPFTVTLEGGSLTLPAYGESGPIPLEIDGQGPFEIFRASFVSEQAQGYTVELLDADNRAVLTNREVHVATIASGNGTTTLLSGAFPPSTSGGRPFIWPTTYFMDPSEGGMIVVNFRNLSGSENTIKFALHGRRWLYLQAPDHIAQRMAQIYRSKPRIQPFFYTTDQMVELAGDASGNFVSRFGDDGWHELVKLMSISTGNFNVQISEKVTGKRYMQQFLPNPLVFGSAEFPFLMFEESLYEPNFRLNFGLVDTSGETNTIWITMAGRKLLFDPMDDQFRRPGYASGKD